MPIRPPRWLRSARRRPAAFAALLVLSACTVIVSALTPMLLGSVAAGGLADRIAALTPPEDGITATAIVPSPDLLPVARTAVDDALGAVGPGSLWGGPRRIIVTSAPVRWRLDGSSSTAARRTTLSIVDDCTGLTLTSGRCPTSVAEVAIPASVSVEGGPAVGERVAFQQGQEAPMVARVVGVYDDRIGAGRALADPDALVGSGLAHPVSNPVLGGDRIGTLAYPIVVEGVVRIARPVRQVDVLPIRRAVAAAKRTALGTDAAQTSATVSSDLVDVLAGVRAQETAAVTLTTPIALEALALGWFALAFVMQRTARARAVEWGIGRTRGLRPAPRIATVFLEPAIAIGLGALLGFGVAVVVAETASAVAVGPSGAVEPLAPLPLAAAGLALAGSLVALVVASARSASLPLDVLLRDTTEPRRLSRLALVGQVAAVLVAVAVLVSVLTTRLSSGPQLALALPILLALVAGIAALRATVLVVQRVARRPPRSLVALVAGRGLARAPSVLTAAVLVLVASALAGYSLQLDAVSGRTQDDRADLVTGAPTVATVRVPPGVSLLEAVRNADPSGTVALAAEEVDSPGATGADRVVAVDTARLDAVSNWRPEWRGVPLSRLRPTGGGDLELRGTRLSLTIAGVRSGGAYDLPGGHDLRLDVVLARASGWTTVPLGALRGGVLSARIPCASGCRVVSLDVSDPLSVFPVPWGAVFAVFHISTDVQSAASLAPWLQADRWRNRVATSTDPSLPVRAFPDRLPDRLVVDAQDAAGGQTAALEPATGAVALPAIGGSRADLDRFAGLPGVVFGTDLAHRPLLLRLEGRAPALPRSLTDGVLVDLEQLEHDSDPAAAKATDEVWLAAGRHPAVLAALAEQGVRVTSTTTSAAARESARRSLAPRSIGLVRITAVAAVALALLALIAAWVIDVPVRRREWLALRLAGIPPAALRRIAVVRFVGPSAVAAVLGVPVAALTFAITAGQLPLLAGESAGPPIDASPPWAVLAALVVGLVVLVGLIGAVGARAELPRRGR